MPIKFEAQNAPGKFFAKIANAIYAALYFFGLAVWKFFGILKNAVVLTCYHAGRFIIAPIAKTYTAAKNDILHTRRLFPKRLNLLLEARYTKTLFVFVVIAFLGWATLGSLNLIAKALDIKNKIMHTAFLGNAYLSQAKDALGDQDFSRAENRFSLAYQTLSRGQSQILESGQALGQILNLVPQKRDADKLLEAASLVAQAGQSSISLQQNLSSLKLTAAGISGDGRTAEIFESLEGDLSRGLNQISRANNLVAEVDVNNLPAENREAFSDLKQKLFIAQFSLSNFKEVFAVAKNLLLGEKHVLLLFENNNELRAGGGFIGTYGDLKIQDDNITKINVSSVYDLDGQLKQNIRPPVPILNINDRWFLRDANWFASWPESAKKISSFYEMEGNQTPDLVIAITPNIIVDWLKITGPVSLPAYGATLTNENFVEQTQAISTISDNLPTNSPKQILADLFPLLLGKISSAESALWPQIIQSLQDNLNSKQIVIYSKDPSLQKQLADFHWDGGLKATDRDFLSIVASNLGGTKTDLFIDQKISLTTQIASDGAITNELEITRTNKMPELAQTENTSYLRIYTPLGSKLISNIGFDYKRLVDLNQENYQVDDDLRVSEENSVTENLTQTTIGRESGKTFFGNWLELKGGQTKTIKLVYQLPFKLNEIDRHSLLLQKQIGAINANFSWTLNFQGRQIDWKNFDTNSLDTSSLNSDILLSKDYFLGMVMEKR